MRGTRYGRVLAAVAAALLLGACSRTLDMKKIETEIKDGIERQAEITIASIDCPDSRDAKDGDEFTCSITAEDGTKGTVRVTQTSDDGDITWAVE